jgi:hypothetical protein
MKKSHLVGLGVLLAALPALLFLVLPVTPNLIIAYVFWLLAIAALMWGVFAFGAKGRGLLLELPFFLKTRTYLVLTAVLSFVVLLLENLGVYAMPAALHAVVQLALLLVMGIQVMKLNLGKAHIVQVETKVTDARSSLLALVGNVNALKHKAEGIPGEMGSQVIKALGEVSDALRYADPISNESVKDIDASIAEKVAGLAKLVEEGQGAEVLVLVKGLLSDVKTRADRLKHSK